ncbi:MAG: COX15/CtaA family protein, partial [Methylomonas sp.]
MFRKITLFGALLALLVIVLGAYVRLSNAGLGCPDWPGCYGQALVSDSAEFKNAVAQNFPAATLDTGKAWKEMTHRYFAAALGIIVLAMLPLAWRLTAQRLAALVLTSGLLLLIILQALLGMWTVNFKVMPIVVTAHMLLGFISFWLFSWTYLRTQPDIAVRRQRAGPAGFAHFAMPVLLLQIVLGGWVSSNYAALACSDFPLCNGVWWPEADYAGALNLLHGLLSGDSSTLPFAGQLAANNLHRLGAALSFAVLLPLAISAARAVPKSIRVSGWLLGVLLLTQIALGAFNVVFDLPLWNAVAHNAFAALLMLPVLGIYFHGKYASAAPVKPEAAQPPVAAFAPEPPSAAPVVEIQEPVSLFLRLKNQLKKTRGGLGEVLNSLTFGQNAVTRELLEEIETSLIM